jgi:phosphinothricin acetyltransferase
MHDSLQPFNCESASGEADCRRLMIRLATPVDAAAIASVYNHYIKHSVATFEVEPLSATDMRSRIEAGMPAYPWLVASDTETVCGYACATPWKSRAAYGKTVETSVYVAPEHHGNGVGESLYRALLEHLATEGFHCALGGIALPNPASIALHEKLGFTKVGELKQVGWKHNRWVNVGYWQCFLQPPDAEAE